MWTVIPILQSGHLAILLIYLPSLVLAVLQLLVVLHFLYCLLYKFFRNVNISFGSGFYFRFSFRFRYSFFFNFFIYRLFFYRSSIINSLFNLFFKFFFNHFFLTTYILFDKNSPTIKLNN